MREEREHVVQPHAELFLGVVERGAERRVPPQLRKRARERGAAEVRQREGVCRHAGDELRGEGGAAAEGRAPARALGEDLEADAVVLRVDCRANPVDLVEAERRRAAGGCRLRAGA